VSTWTRDPTGLQSPLRPGVAEGPSMHQRKDRARPRRDPVRLRLGVLAIAVVFMFGALFTRLWFLQVLSADTHVEQAQSNQIDVVELPATRGRILDRNGVVLADNEFVSVVSVDARAWQDPEADRALVVEELSRLLGMTPAEVSEQLDDETQDPLVPKVIKDDVEEATRVLVEERHLPGVRGELRAVRNYPQHDLAAHVLGYVGPITEDQIEAEPERYDITDRVGRAGVEMLFEKDLRGDAGRRLLEVNRQREVVGTAGEDVPPVAGEDLYLTLDARVQRAAEEAIVEQLELARQRQSEDSGNNFPASAGAAVVLDVDTGDIVALASYPDYDPNWLIGGLTKAQFDSHFLDAQVPSPLNNRAIQGLYAPGSTFKLITALAGLRAHTLDAREMFNDEGYFEIPDADTCPTTVQCRYANAREAVLGLLDLSGALIKSSDAYFYRQGYLLDRTGDGRELQETAARLGFGSATGVQLPFEATGRVPSAELKAQLADEGVIPDGHWLNGDNINLAVGQGFLAVTPLQLTNAYATWANGGTKLNPNIVDRVADRTDGEVRRVLDRRVSATLEFPTGNDVIWEGLSYVTRSGTAEFAFQGYDHDAFGVIGKTGTAQAEGASEVTGITREDTAIFAGVAPREDPRYAVVVLLEEAGFGGDAAAPAARSIFEALHSAELEDAAALEAESPAEPEPTEPELDCSATALMDRFGQGTAVVELGLETVAEMVGCDPAELGPIPPLVPGAPGVDLAEGRDAPVDVAADGTYRRLQPATVGSLR